MATSDTGSPLPAAISDNPDAGHQAGVFPPFDAHNFLPQLIWLVVIFGALYWLMSRIALPRVQDILDARRARIAQDLESARAMQSQAEAAGEAYGKTLAAAKGRAMQSQAEAAWEAYGKTLAAAKGRAQALAQQTHDALHAQSETRRHALESDLNGKLAAAEAQIADTKTRAMSNVEAIARDAAAAIVQHITGRASSEDQLTAAAGATKAR